MEGNRNLIAAIVVIAIVLVVIIGTILILTNSLGGKINLLPSLPNLNLSRKTPAPSLQQPQPTTEGSPVSTPAGQGEFKGDGFSLKYPANWGLLTCSTSQNIELDPYNPDKQTVPCDYAIKPVTVLVGDNWKCPEQTTQIGPHKVAKSKISADGKITYQWCVRSDSKLLNITHRVSASGERATSKDDFSSAIEEIISSIRF